MLAYLFVLLAVAVHIRFVALPFSFTPVLAALLYFGARMPRKQMWVPVALLIAGDVYLNHFVYAYPLGADQFVTWGWYAAMILLGAALIKGFSPLRILTGAVSGAVSFFLISNFAVWMTWHDMYPKTWQGLLACYAAALPFFRNGIASDLLFSAAFFAIGYIATQRSSAAVPVTVVQRDR